MKHQDDYNNAQEVKNQLEEDLPERSIVKVLNDTTVVTIDPYDTHAANELEIGFYNENLMSKNIVPVNEWIAKEELREAGLDIKGFKLISKDRDRISIKQVKENSQIKVNNEEIEVEE